LHKKWSFKATTSYGTLAALTAMVAQDMKRAADDTRIGTTTKAQESE
jgi:hypothetical protein